MTAWVLIKIRHRGPGLWWSAICVALALGVLVVPFGIPFGVLTGGVALPGLVGPATWGLLFLAIEMLLLHRAYNLGYRRALYGLIPLFVLWANVDESFFMGLLLLAAAVIGRAVDGQAAEILVRPANAPHADLEQAGNRRYSDAARFHGDRLRHPARSRSSLAWPPLDLSRFHRRDHGAESLRSADRAVQARQDIFFGKQIQKSYTDLTGTGSRSFTW